MISRTYGRWVELFLLLLLALTLAYMTGLERQQQDLSRDLIRLHIRAESDEAEDQAIKRKVRDALLLETDEILCDAETTASAKEILIDNLDKLEQTANTVLLQNGCNSHAAVSVKRELFGMRSYNGHILPGGYYDALRVDIGRGEGRNWWCVVYPQICTFAVTETDVPAMGTVEERAWVIPEDRGEYELRFKMVELFENLMGWFRAGSSGIPDSG